MQNLLFSNYVRQSLKAKKLSVSELSSYLGHSNPRQVQSWEDGHALPSVDMWQEVAEGLGVNPVELMAGCLIEMHPEMEGFLRATVLNPLGSSYPDRNDDFLVATKLRPRFDVADPHDEPEPEVERAAPVVRKRSAAAR
ncbi:helix-turn-helix domain-containing protein [Brevundimonas naejangsanensis]|uniref:helix-turn-helix domain-containing protein n=1 Tax=Brevundimonas naejangsanensis TaxID=588932 RepID=UPI0009DB9AD7|nr:helix-turn-helix transcriptional regulator [Brevundimonas naejangsanensis]